MKQDKTALITGPTSGIGYELAKLFAKEKYTLVLVSRNKARLEEIARKFRKKHNIFVKIIIADLSNPKAYEALSDQISTGSLKIDVLVNNAGFGAFGMSFDLDREMQLDMINLNVMAVTALSHAAAIQMKERGSGRILNLASTAAFLSGPKMAVYYATKNYVLAFSEALAEELSGTGVTVTTLCPGPTRTSFPERAGAEHSKFFKGNLTDAIQVAEIGFDGLMKGERLVVPGKMSKVSVNVPRFLPRSWMTKMVAKFQETKG